MNAIIGSLLLSMSSAFAVPPKAFVCSAECLGVNVNARSVSFMGTIESVGQSRFEAWKKLHRKCEKLLRYSSGTPLLSQGTILVNIDQSTEASSWFDSQVSFSYSSLRISNAGHRSFQQKDRFTLEVTPARSASSCNLEEVSEEDLIDYYDGDLPVFG